LYRREEDPLGLRIPRQWVETVLQKYHDDCGHMARTKVLGGIKKKYFWSGMEKDIIEYLQRCTTCKVRNMKEIRCPMQEVDRQNNAFQKISVDIAGPFPVSNLGNKYILSFAAFPLQGIKPGPSKMAGEGEGTMIILKVSKFMS
jgi:hypothetical protein